jgi:phage terminase large subunit-like protein
MQLSDAERDALREAAHCVLARDKFIPYCTFVDRGYLTPKHLILTGEYLEAIERNDIQRLIIIEPPRHGKSETACGKFPSWFVSRDTNRKVIMATHTSSLAEAFSIQNRDTIDHNPYHAMVFPGVSLSPSVRASDKWALYGQRETMIAAGIGGPITGFGAHLLLIDDPVKNQEEAESQASQKRVWDWYRTTARTRLQNSPKPGVIVIIMTHWNDGDLVGRILNSPEARDYTVLHLPAESFGTKDDVLEEEQRKMTPAMLRAFPDPLDRPRGDPLWPEMGYTKEVLASARAVLQHLYSGLYQGLPGAPEGELFARDKFIPMLRPFLKESDYECLARARSFDLAWSDSQRADYTATVRASLWALQPGVPHDDVLPSVLVLLESAERWKEDADVNGDHLVKTILRDPGEYGIIVESVAAQTSIFKSLRTNPVLSGRALLAHKPFGDKVARARYAMRLNGLGIIVLEYQTLTTHPTWEPEFLDELATFPHGVHDDWVDALSQLCNEWRPLIDANILRIKAPIIQKKKELPFELRRVNAHKTHRDRHAWSEGVM